ncbi:MAG: hypothetical protein U0802_00885 [Candidatus Binatia bacterium]
MPVTGNRIAAALAERGVDGVVTDSAELAVWPGGAGGLRVLARFGIDHKAPLLPADRADLAAHVGAWLMAREADGWLDAERVRALGPGAALDAAGASRQAVAALIGLRLALMPDVAAAKRAAGLPLEDRGRRRACWPGRAQVPSAPDRAALVYAHLIVMAKAAQRAAPRAPTPGPRSPRCAPRSDRRGVVRRARPSPRLDYRAGLARGAGADRRRPRRHPPPSPRRSPTAPAAQ